MKGYETRVGLKNSLDHVEFNQVDNSYLNWIFFKNILMWGGSPDHVESARIVKLSEGLMKI